MHNSSMRVIDRFALFALFAACAGVAEARTLSLTATRLVDARASAQGLRVQIVEQKSGGSLVLAAEHFESALLGLAGRLDWSCPLQREADGTLACSGPVRLREGDREQQADLRVRIAAQSVELALERTPSRVVIALPLAGGSVSASATLERIPATWLKAPLATFWSGGELRSGTFDAKADLLVAGGITASYVGDNVGFNTFDGVFSGAALAVRGQLATTPAQQAMRVTTDAHFSGGELRAGALHVAFPTTPVDVVLDALVHDDGQWQIAHFDWHDPEVLEFEASGVLEPAAVAPLRSLSVKVGHAQFPLVTTRYAEQVFASYGFGQLALRGTATATIEVAADGLSRLALDAKAFDLRDRGLGIAIEGIDGGIDWVAHGAGDATELAWRKANVAGVAFGAAKSRWQAQDGELRLQGTLRTRVSGGTLELRRTALNPFATQGERVRSAFIVRDLGYDSADGSLAAAHVGAEGELQLVGTNAAPQIRLDAKLLGGEALVGPVYAKLPDSAVTTRMDVGISGDRWHIEQLDWNDPGVLEFNASGDLAPREAKIVAALQLVLRDAQLGPALQRYAQTWLANKGYPDLHAGGRLSGSMRVDAGKVQQFAFAAKEISIRDGGGRFTLDGLDGAIDWDIATDRPGTSLGWRTLELFRIPFGAARAQLASHDAAIALAQPLAVDVLGGQLKLERFSAQPSSPRGDRYAGSFAISGIEMARLSETFGWPRFPGNLSGGIPEIEFVGDRIEFHGGLDLYVFDGHLGVSGLALERPFGVAPSLAADVHFENLDLEQLTSAFSFGGMSGRLMGSIASLRLVDWSPVAFDAWLRTDGGGRMSYKAVNDLTSIGGGGGLSASLQTMALKIFDTFGYRHLGLRCVLHDEICTMGGIDPIPAEIAAGGTGSSTDGYTIVEGSGLPRIMIVGHRRQVDWPTLVRRLQEATQGQGPVIE